MYKLIILFSILLAGCNVPSWNLAQAEKQCSSYNFTPGTEAYSNCVMVVTQQITQQNINTQMMLSNTITPINAVNPRPVNCTPQQTVYSPNPNQAPPPTYTCR
jgi:hypothetical protein